MACGDANIRDRSFLMRPKIAYSVLEKLTKAPSPLIFNCRSVFRYRESSPIVYKIEKKTVEIAV